MLIRWFLFIAVAATILSSSLAFSFGSGPTRNGRSAATGLRSLPSKATNSRGSLLFKTGNSNYVFWKITIPRRQLKQSRGGGATTTTSTTSLPGALSLSIPELAEQMGGVGRAKLAWDLYKQGVDPAIYYAPGGNILFDPVTIQPLLPSPRRNQTLGMDALAKLYAINGNRTMDGLAKVAYISTSSDRTTKLLLELADGAQIETVIIPTNARSTLCISSQVGCRQACTFCATGTMGMRRNLSSDEIIVQLFHAKSICRTNNLPPIANIVFMGMGEPTDNMDNVNKAIDQLTTRELFQLSAHKVCVSTVAPNPEVFSRISPHCALAWSVHAAQDHIRRQLVPTTRYTMNELRDGYIAALQRRKIKATMLEYVLIANVNDDEKSADALAELANTIVHSVDGSGGDSGHDRCKLLVNLIPYNSISTATKTAPTTTTNPTTTTTTVKRQESFRAPDFITIRAFQKRLWIQGVHAHVRTTRGDDESAACGQLVTMHKQQQQQRPPKEQPEARSSVVSF